ncbi:hypothetical protein [Actinoplanes xinjiangensis]|uniref:hypothetical protein n=1 Tax=Actinoplanes xinjiangensis TaxID=512350 RepID=UPI000D6AB54C|nr:hypothetical protein [Actinoplanes xinjiangensis]GIF43828.1 hypothetical protein Axi01nite_81390 [Actinoplanes xinjiangensis]
MFALTGQIVAGGAGVTLALGVLLVPPPDEEFVLVSRRLEPISVVAGGTARFDLPFTHTGTSPVTGAVLAVGSRHLAKTYRNCSTVGVHLVCTFGTRLEPGAVYGLSEPLAFRPPADSITGSRMGADVTWYTRTGYAAHPIFTPEPGATYVWLAEPPEPRWGTEPQLTLKRLVDPPPDPPETDDPWDEFEEGVDITVTDGRPADLAVSGARTTVTSGPSTVRVRLTNHGPGRLYPDLYTNNDPSLLVTFPGGTTATTDPEGCYRYADLRTLECDGETDFTIPVRVTRPEAGAGRVEIVDHRFDPLELDDPDRSNNSAGIVSG